MDSENSHLKENDESPNDELSIEDESGSDGMEQLPVPENPAVGKITLTSRRTKKHVTIHEESSGEPKEIADVEVAVNNLENNFANGVEEIRQSLKLLMSDRKSFELHIKSLEESLRKSTQEKEKYRMVMQQMKDEIETLTSKLEGMKEDKKTLEDENKSLQSDHEGQLKSIAEQHRRKYLAKRTVKKWRGKLKKNIASSGQVAELLEENRRLKSELLLYQEAAKHAFLRSANVLNSEALTLFQNTATRRLNAHPADGVYEDDSFKGSNSDVSVSDQASSASTNESDVDREKENERRSRHRKDPFSSFAREAVKRNIEYLSDDTRSNGRKRNLNVQTRPHSDNELNLNFKSGPKPKPRTEEFLPDPLRRETRRVMKQLEMNRRPNLNLHSDTDAKIDKSDPCHSKTHVHVCHCTPLPGRPGNCPYCFANQNYNFANMPRTSKAKPDTKFDKSKRDSSSLYDHVTGERSRVIYKPSGSTVVIEKHLGK